MPVMSAGAIMAIAFLVLFAVYAVIEIKSRYQMGQRFQFWPPRIIHPPNTTARRRSTLVVPSSPMRPRRQNTDMSIDLTLPVYSPPTEPPAVLQPGNDYEELPPPPPYRKTDINAGFAVPERAHMS
ncbi:hypothetical protein FBU31_005417 [Coemansia sp. 'formosensis']|nr:hypothetical protein FBU31_005417 [Coemansia sp. 'formosensis']